MSTYTEFCTTITQQLFNIIETKGSLLSWHKNWDSLGSAQLPLGANGLYHGANILPLLNAQWSEGFQSNQWFTFHQIQEQGGYVKKGAKSRTVFFWMLNKTEREVDGEKIEQLLPVFKTYRVFNAEQSSLELASIESPVFQAHIVDAWVAKLGVTVSHFGSRAYYSQKDDVIVIPNIDRFQSQHNYYATLLHELVHASAGQNRLQRQCADDYDKHPKARAAEELVAEIGSVFLAIHCGLKAEVENHASYIQHWKTLLTEQEIMSATHKAAKAFEWIIQ